MWNYFKKQKIGIFSILVGLTYAFLVGNSFIDSWDYVKPIIQGWQSADPKTAASDVHFLTLRPKDGIKNFPDSLVNFKTNQTVRVQCRKIFVLTPPSNTKSTPTALYFVLALLYLIAFVRIPYHLYKILGLMKSNRIFDRKNIRLLRWLGAELLTIYCVSALNIGLSSYLFSSHSIPVNLSNYDIVKSSVDPIWLLLGVIALLIAEIFSKAMVLKEEQELTI